MKRPKSVNLYVVVLALLFVLSQTTFALTATMTSEGGSKSSQTEQDSVQASVSKDYDIDTNGNRVSTQETNSTWSYLPATNNTTSAATALTANVTAQAVKAPEPLAAPAQEPVKPVVRYINANELNVRSEASADSKLVTTLKRGDKVSFYETNGDWAKIKTWSDKDGYILAKYLVDSEKDVEKVETEQPKKETKKVSRGNESSAAASEPATDEQLSLIEKVVSFSKTLQGVRYVYGGYSTKGLDCSGFTKYVYAKYGVELPRSAAEYWSFGKKVSRSDLRAGDILLFDTDGGSADVSHVGLYIGGGNFIHASSYKGHVVVMSLSEYRGKYMGARRVVN